MRFMVLVKANKDSEAGVLPDEQILAAMGKYNEELVEAGVMLAGDGLQPSSKGARVRFDGKKRTVIDPSRKSRSSWQAIGCGSAARKRKRLNGSNAHRLRPAKKLKFDKCTSSPISGRATRSSSTGNFEIKWPANRGEVLRQGFSYCGSARRAITTRPSIAGDTLPFSLSQAMT
jgi:hypothetical protein